MMKAKMNAMFKTLGSWLRSQSATMRCALVVLLTVALTVGSLPMNAFAYMAQDLAFEAELTQDGEEDAGVQDAPAPEDDPQLQSEPADEGDDADEGAVQGNAALGQDEPSGEEGASGTVDESSGGSSDNEPTSDSQPSAGSAAGGKEADEGKAAPQSDAEYFDNDGLRLVTIQGEATRSSRSTREALEDTAKVEGAKAAEATGILDAARNAGTRAGENEDGLKPDGDGNFVDWLLASWVTEDSEPGDNDADCLYQKPTSDDLQSVRLRISYALSGENDYSAGDITIRVPVNIFTDRDGKSIGSMRLSVPEDPSNRADWNYKRIGDEYVITNTHAMSAATQGFMEFAYEGLLPHNMKDMALSAEFKPVIEVVTHEGNLIGRVSQNALTARFDTHVEVQSATKRLKSPVKIVGKDSIPAEQQIEGVEKYVLVTWFMNCYVPYSATSAYTLELTDTKNDGYKGFVIGQTEGDAPGSEKGIASGKHEDLYDGKVVYEPGDSLYTTVEVAYPLDQFEKDQNYTFKNRVEYVLTEADEETDGLGAERDPKQVTKKETTAQVIWSYEDPQFIEPEGHFNLFKYGNSNVLRPDGTNMETIGRDGNTVSGDLAWTVDPGYSPWNGYYGEYPAALNGIRRDEDQTISYTLNTVGYILPWTYQEPEEVAEGTNPRGQLENYGKKPVTLVTEDKGLSLKDTGSNAIYDNGLKVGEDFTYESIEFPERPHIMCAQAINLDENGNPSFGSADDGTVDYEIDSDFKNVPDVTLQIKMNGEWKDYATASWKETGKISISFTDGSGASTNGKVILPEGVEGVRTTATATNAALLYHVRVNTKLLHAGQIGKVTDEKFAGSPNPSLSVWDYATMTASQDNRDIVTINKRGYDRLRGYTTDTRATLAKSSKQELEDVDNDAQKVTIHYSAEMKLQSFISDKTAYEQAIEDGELQAETGCTWYDLLPKGVVPVFDSVRLREGDTVRNMYTIENYKGSGRTLFVVEAELSPIPERYKDSEGEVFYYQDVPSITFDATIDFTSIIDFGKDIHNVIAYQSNNEELGTVEGYRGEPDDPSRGNNNGTKAAFEGHEEEIVFMTDLDPDDNNNNFLYAGVRNTIDKLDAGQSSLDKKVMVNNDGWWSDGLTKIDPDAARDVYASGLYSYRVSFRSATDTVTSDMVLYDSLENFEPTKDNDPIDAKSGRWHGIFAGVDVSALQASGCYPKVYYSTQDNLKLDQRTGTGSAVDPVEENMLFDNNGGLNKDVWHPLTDETDLETVKAIAVDARYTSDGKKFELRPEEEISFYINMRAPQGEEAESYIEQDAHAFNNAHMSARNRKVNSQDEVENFIRKDYTKVGLVSYELNVKKNWDDADNQDGKRPGSVTVHLYADGKPAEEEFPNQIAAEEARLTLSNENEWSGTFNNLPYLRDNGAKIVYSIVEEGNLTDYAGDIRFDGNTFTITNRHEPEKVSVAGTKTWEGDTEGVRPDSIKVNLYADGTLLKSKTIKADHTGAWNYEFAGLDKYKDGKEIVYTVEEDITSAPSYIHGTEGTDLTNVYHPYGDLEFTKTVEDVTAASRDAEFTFKLVFTKDTDEIGEDGKPVTVPVFDEFDYKVFNEGEDVAVGGGKVSTDGSITLKGGQRAVVSNIPEYVHYQIKEERKPGFTAKETVATGEVAPNETQRESFTNVYAASTQISLGARKTLTGHALSKYQFRYELRDADGTVIRTASNGNPDDASTAGDGSVVQSAPIDFGAIAYTQGDHGKTFEYTIHEIEGNRPGYTYDQTIYRVSVTVADNGDGTLKADVAYFDGEGNPITGGSSEGSEAIFKNSYTAKGSVALQASKTVRGGSLSEGQFAFELGRVDINEGMSTFTSIQNDATNGADGTVVFKPIEYTQADAGKEYLYAIHEIKGSDTDITYDEHWFLVNVSVKDSGDGTLSVRTVFDNIEAPCWICGGDGKTGEAGDACSVCGGEGTITSTSADHEFVNTYAPGTLDVKKTLSEDSKGEYDPNELFDFRVELTNEEGEPVDGITQDDIKFGRIGEDGNVDFPEEGASETTATEEGGNPLIEFGKAAIDFFVGLFTPTEAYAAEIIESGNEGTWRWSVDANGLLVIGGTGIAQPKNRWTATDVKEVSFEKGSSAGGSLQALFQNHENLEIADMRNLDMSQATNVSYLFGNCKKLQEVNLEGVNTSSVNNLQYMFGGCSSLIELDLSDLDTSNVTTMEMMFSNCSSLSDLNIASLDTSNVTNMEAMFRGCLALQKLDLSHFKTSKVKNMSLMFARCVALSDLRFSADLDTSNVTTMASMFDMEQVGSSQHYSSSLTELDLSSFDTQAVTNMSYMFRGCNSLTELDLSSFDTRSVTNMSGMFALSAHYTVPDGKSKLKSLNISSFDTSSVKNMYRMFSSCASLEELEFPKSFDTSKVTNMQAMFNDCEMLQILDLSRFSTLNVEKMSEAALGVSDGMFSGCNRLERIVFPETFVTAKVQDTSYMFSGCSSLLELDLSSFDTSSVTSMDGMFSRCGALASINLSSLNTENVSSMRRMFSDCESLQSLDLSNFDTANVTNMNGMFGLGYSSSNLESKLESITFSEKFVTSNVKDMGDMFKGCSALTELNLSSFDTAQASTMNMFVNCSKLRKVVLGDHFKFKSQDSGSILPTPGVGKQKWIRTKALSGQALSDGVSCTSKDLAENFPSDPYLPGTYEWDESISITFDSNGGVGNLEPQSAKTDADVVLNIAGGNIYKTGSVFTGWNTHADGTGDTYDDGGTIPRSKVEEYLNGSSDGFTLFAQWKPFDVVVTDGVVEFSMPAYYVARLEGLPAGTTYRVYEKVDGKWQISKEEGTSGVISTNGTSTASFENQLAQDGRASARIQARKMLDGVWARPGSFTFKLIETTNDVEKVVQDGVTVGEGGTVAFDPIEYTVAGTYTYEIREVIPESPDAPIEYDKTVEKVTVVVSGDDSGKLFSTVKYDETDDDPGVAKFMNKTKSGSLEIRKVAEGPEGAVTRSFSFKLMVSGKPYEGEYTVGDGRYSADNGTLSIPGNKSALIEGLESGAAYSVEEIEVPDGWTLDATQGATGTIEPDVQASVTFTNKFTDETTAELVAYKELKDGDLTDGQFSFELYKVTEGGALDKLETATNGPVDTNEFIPEKGEGGNIVEVPNPYFGLAPARFSALTYNEVGTYKYEIREVVPDEATNADGITWGKATQEQKAAGGFSLDGIVYDASVVKATVTVSLDDRGLLKSSVEYKKGETSSSTFTNELLDMDLTIKKVVENFDQLSDAAKSADFTFKLDLKSPKGESLQDCSYKVFDEGKEEAVDAGVVSDGGSIVLKSNQRAVISGLPYGSSYRVVEQASSGWQQVVEKTTGTEGALKSGDAEAVFTNAYSATGEAVLGARKELIGGNLKDGQFEFALRDVTEGSEEYGNVIQQVTNTKEGDVLFDPIAYTDADDGKTYSYQISEIAYAEDGDYVFDESVVDVKVSVADKGDGTLECAVTYDGGSGPHTFQNWVATVLARTGGPGVTLAGVFMLAAGCAWYLGRRRRSVISEGGSPSGK